MSTEPGLPGTLTEVAYILPPDTTLKEWGRIMGRLGGVGHSIQWWAVDALQFGEDHWPESFAQYVDSLGLSPHRLSTLCWVARKWPRARRRDDLSFGHHEALAALPQEEQDRWMDRVVTGERLPNGETKRWSVTRLKKELRALSASTASSSDSSRSLESATTADSAPVVLDVGMRVTLPNLGVCRIEQLTWAGVGASVASLSVIVTMEVPWPPAPIAVAPATLSSMAPPTPGLSSLSSTSVLARAISPSPPTSP